MAKLRPVEKKNHREGLGVSELGALFASARKTQNLAVQDVAAYLNVKDETVLMYEAGEKGIPLSHVFALANYLNVSPAEVMKIINQWKDR